MESKDFGNRNGDRRKGRRTKRVGGIVAGDLLVGLVARIAMDFDGAPVEVDDPDFWDSVPGVEGKLDIAILAQRGVRPFDE